MFGNTYEMGGGPKEDSKTTFQRTILKYYQVALQDSARKDRIISYLLFYVYIH